MRVVLCCPGFRKGATSGRIGAATGILGLIPAFFELFGLGGSDPPPITNNVDFTVCGSGCCFACPGYAPFVNLKRQSPGSINGCSDPSCFCQASGLLGVQPNPFDDKCATFINCPSTVAQSCGPGTLFNAQFSVCDFPSNVDCVAVQF